MAANPKFLAATAQVDDAAVKPLPNSAKIYVQGSRPDIRVPMREISQADTLGHGSGNAGSGSTAAEKNPPIYVYDCSGPYTDPAAKIDIRSGLTPLRGRWIEERGDTEALSGPTSRYGRERLADLVDEQRRQQDDSVERLAAGLGRRDGLGGRLDRRRGRDRRAHCPPRRCSENPPGPASDRPARFAPVQGESGSALSARRPGRRYTR